MGVIILEVFDVFWGFSLGRVVLYTVFMVFSLSQTLVKTLAKNLVKNFLPEIWLNIVYLQHFGFFGWSFREVFWRFIICFPECFRSICRTKFCRTISRNQSPTNTKCFKVLNSQLNNPYFWQYCGPGFWPDFWPWFLGGRNIMKTVYSTTRPSGKNIKRPFKNVKKHW